MVKSQDGCEVQFGVRPTTLLQKVHCAYAATRSLELDNLNFACDGVLLHPDRTVQESELEDGDIIDSLSLMLGD